MDPLQYLHECRGKEVELALVHGERFSGVLVAADDHGNVILQNIAPSWNHIQSQKEEKLVLCGKGSKRPRPLFPVREDSVRFIRGSIIKAVSSLE